METIPRLETLEKIENTCVPDIIGVFREEGLDAASYALFDTTGWHVEYDLCI